jgi:hypothetical protein
MEMEHAIIAISHFGPWMKYHTLDIKSNVIYECGEESIVINDLDHDHFIIDNCLYIKKSIDRFIVRVSPIDLCRKRIPIKTNNVRQYCVSFKYYGFIRKDYLYVGFTEHLLKTNNLMGKDLSNTWGKPFKVLKVFPGMKLVKIYDEGFATLVLNTYSGGPDGGINDICDGPCILVNFISQREDGTIRIGMDAPREKCLRLSGTSIGIFKDDYIINDKYLVRNNIIYRMNFTDTHIDIKEIYPLLPGTKIDLISNNAVFISYFNGLENWVLNLDNKIIVNVNKLVSLFHDGYRENSYLIHSCINGNMIHVGSVSCRMLNSIAEQISRMMLVS